MKALRLKVRMFGLTTRLFILILQFVCNWVIPDHEAGKENFNNFSFRNFLSIHYYYRCVPMASGPRG